MAPLLHRAAINNGVNYLSRNLFLSVHCRRVELLPLVPRHRPLSGR